MSHVTLANAEKVNEFRNLILSFILYKLDKYISDFYLTMSDIHDYSNYAQRCTAIADTMEEHLCKYYLNSHTCQLNFMLKNLFLSLVFLNNK